MEAYKSNITLRVIIGKVWVFFKIPTSYKTADPLVYSITLYYSKTLLFLDYPEIKFAYFPNLTPKSGCSIISGVFIVTVCLPGFSPLWVELLYSLESISL